MQKHNFALIAAATLAFGTCGATLTLPRYSPDNMIVHQNTTLTLKGHAAPESEVLMKAGWNNKTGKTRSDSDGNFTMKLATPPAGGPYSVIFSDKDGTTTVENVLSGEVWLCSGQSNMEYPVQGWTSVMDHDRVVATAHHPDIRLLQIRKTTAFSPREDVEVNGGGWQTCTSASMADFSAIAYFFACELAEKLKVPVGVIDATWGGTPAEAWTSAKALGAVPGFENELADMKAAGYDADTIKATYRSRMADWIRLATSSTEDFDKATLQSGSEWRQISAPGYWEQKGLPGLDGIVWMQKSIDISPEDAGKPVSLNFRAIDDEDETYFNGVLVGKGSGYDTPRSYTVPGSAVRAGANIITIKISDFGGEGGIAPGVAEARTAHSAVPLDGSWQYMVQTDFSKLPPKPADPGSSSYPSVLYNAMLSPLGAMPVKGVLWYQGCANVGRDEQYATLFKALINDWRSIWGEKLPFYFVQLAGFLEPKAVQPDSEWAALRNSQAKALELDNTAMAVAADLGNPADIHPKNKQDVAHRLALIALNRDYGDDCVYEAPRCVSVKTVGNGLELRFDGPVKATTTAITGFIIAGKDGHFTTATPEQPDERTIILRSHAVDAPVAVRYNWADYPQGNLYGPTGLPVAPFANDK
ncbi:MAG: 9-O-acetylesterase [Muribaculaceae bacterium]|nr:9-O-acetylesterase [Muribaculaceae bacterium]